MCRERVLRLEGVSIGDQCLLHGLRGHVNLRYTSSPNDLTLSKQGVRKGQGSHGVVTQQTGATS